jgi:hypothetical protein
MSAPSPRILALLAALPLAAAGCSRAAPPAPPVAVQAKFVGRAACVECHAAEDERWTGSHHDLAMQEPTEQTVLGDFSGTSFTYHGVTSTFTRKDGRFFARTDGPDGALHDYEIAYTLGVHPLQQYLIRFPGGRLQALNVCWDTRPKEQGGQRWFHLYPDEDVRHDDVLHWTGPYQNWNYMCADCHSTEVSKGFDAASDTFQTTWKELDVSCEACHGPCSEHVAWGQAHRDAKGPWAEGETLGLVARLAETWPGAWVMNEKAGIARVAGRAVDLRALPHAAQLGSRGLAARAEPARHAPAGAAGAAAVPRRRPDPGGGVRGRIVPAEPHAQRGRDLHGLPRPAHAQDAARQRGLRALPPARAVRHPRAPPPP